MGERDYLKKILDLYMPGQVGDVVREVGRRLIQPPAARPQGPPPNWPPEGTRYAPILPQTRMETDKELFSMEKTGGLSGGLSNLDEPRYMIPLESYSGGQGAPTSEEIEAIERQAAKEAAEADETPLDRLLAAKDDVAIKMLQAAAEGVGLAETGDVTAQGMRDSIETQLAGPLLKRLRQADAEGKLESDLDAIKLGRNSEERALIFTLAMEQPATPYNVDDLLKHAQEGQ